MRIALVFPLISALAATFAGCPELPEPVLCGTIPEGGCPAGRGGSCDDVLCEALYDCVDGAWTRTVDCARADAGTGADAGSDGGALEGGPCTEVVIDVSGKATGCAPDLQEPDCPVEAAMGCAESVCLTGCADFFLCTKAGWEAVAYCDDQTSEIVVID